MKKVFLTGATGFLGGEVLVLLSKNVEVESIHCLVRAKDDAEAMKRLKQQFELHGDFFPESKIFSVIGDLADCTLSEKLIADGSLSEIDTVIHSAADTHFRSTKLMESINIEGARGIALWAAQLKNLDTFMYVGTATICGKEVTGRVVLEDESPNPDVDHIVKYTRTKSIAETLIRKIIPKEKLLVVRPSSVMGDSRNIEPRDFAILWVFIAINELRLVPARNDAWIDLLSVDYVAKAMEALLFVERKYDAYHISSGADSVSSFSQLSEVIVKLEDDPRPKFLFVGRENMDRVKRIMRNLSIGKDVYDPEYSEHIAYWKERFGNSKTLRIILSCLDDYLKFADQDIILDNGRLLEDTGMEHPVPAHEYMVNNWSYMKEIDVMEWALNS